MHCMHTQIPKKIFIYAITLEGCDNTTHAKKKVCHLDIFVNDMIPKRVFYNTRLVARVK
jgi:hypothetical protein